MLTVKAIKRDLAPYFARQGETLLACLFGSVGQGHANKLSDVDIALLVNEEKFNELDAKRPYGYKTAVIADLRGLLQMNEIDLVLLHETPPLLANEVISEGSLLFCRDANVRIAFEVSVKHRYEEFADDWQAIYAAERGLQTAIQDLIDIGAHILAGLGDSQWNEYREIPLSRARRHIIPELHIKPLQEMIGIRNILVYQYVKVDAKKVYAILRKHLDDFDHFARQIKRFLVEDKSR